MVSSLSKYAFINAKLRARISQILPRDLFSQMAHAPSIDAALAFLRDTPFASLEDIYAKTGDLRLAELDLLKAEIELYRGLRHYLHPNSLGLVEALLTQFEVDNVKNAIRVFFDGSVRKRSIDASMHYILYEPIIHKLPMDVIVNAGSLDEIAGLCTHSPYGKIIRKHSGEVESEGSLFSLEIGLDHYYYENLMHTVARLDRRDQAVALRLLGVEIDLQNISWIIRFKQYFDLPLETVLKTLIPGGLNLNRALIDELYHAQNVTSVLQTFVAGRYPGLSALLSSPSSDSGTRLQLIGRILEEIKQQEVRRIMSGYPFTVGIILAYFVLKRDELKRLRTLINAKYYGKPQERIESML
jgi:V/A-type H+-transporting ATPase subunit C